MRSNIRSLDMPALQARLAHFEAKYGLSSERLFDAFMVNGVLRETTEFHEWCMLYEVLRTVTSSRIPQEPQLP